MYHRLPLKQKKNKESFDTLVSRCPSRETVKAELGRRFIKRA
jgi:hypothetical protein